MRSMMVLVDIAAALGRRLEGNEQAAIIDAAAADRGADARDAGIGAHDGIGAFLKLDHRLERGVGRGSGITADEARIVRREEALGGVNIEIDRQGYGGRTSKTSVSAW